MFSACFLTASGVFWSGFLKVMITDDKRNEEILIISIGLFMPS
jgi:hypothetical protein